VDTKKAKEKLLKSRLNVFGDLKDFTSDSANKIKENIKDNAEICVGLSAFGIISLTLAKFDLFPQQNPDYWEKAEEKGIQEILLVEADVTLEEFKSVLREEIRLIKKEQIDSLTHVIGSLKETESKIQEIDSKLTKIISNAPLLSPNEFQARQENKSIFGSFKHFIGRDAEFTMLNEFLNHSTDKIRIIAGDGGVGKTRLGIEFSKSDYVKDWDVYFVHPEKDFTDFILEKPTLFILDEFSRYKHQDKLIDFVLNSTQGRQNLKLIILDRRIMSKTVVDFLKAKNCHTRPEYLISKNISEILCENLSLNEEDAKRIEETCEGSLVCALMLTTFFLEENKMSDIKSAIHYSLQKYVNDVSYSYGKMSSSDINRIVELIALLRPIKVETDFEILRKELPANIFEKFENMYQFLDETKLFDIDNNFLFLSGEDDSFIDIRPDPLPDYILSEFLLKDNATTIIQKLRSSMSFRITYNIYVTMRTQKDIGITLSTLLYGIWNELNSSVGTHVEYFPSLALLTNIFTENESTFNMVNPDNWYKTYRHVLVSNPESKEMVAEAYSICLANLSDGYGKYSRYDDMETCISCLSTLCSSLKTHEVADKYAGALSNAVHHYGINENYHEVESCLSRLSSLHYSLRIPEVTRLYSMGLFNAINVYFPHSKYSEMESCLSRLSSLFQLENKPIVAENYTKGLANAIYCYGEHEEYVEVESCLLRLSSFYESVKQPKIAENYSLGLVNAISYYVEYGVHVDLKSYLSRLSELYDSFKTPDTTQYYSEGLINAINGYGIHEKYEDMEACLSTLSLLYDSLNTPQVAKGYAFGLFNAVMSYGNNEEFTSMETCLSRLSSLYDAVKTPEIAEEYANGLCKAIFDYASHMKYSEMESCFSHLSLLYATAKIPDFVEKYDECLMSAIDEVPVYIQDFELWVQCLANAISKLPGDEHKFGLWLQLYKFKLFLLNDSTKERLVEEIEYCFLEKLEQVIVEMAKHDDGDVFGFLSWLEHDIDDTEEFAIILAYMLSEPPENIKQIVIDWVKWLTSHE